MTGSEKIVVTNNGYVQDITTTGVNGSNLHSHAEYQNNGTLTINSDQGNTIASRGECKTGVGRK